MEDYLWQLKEKKGYDDQMVYLLSNIIMAFNEVLGDENMPKVLEAIDNVQIIFYDDVEHASIMLSEYYNNGKKYNVGPQASGTGFVEDEYIVSENGEIKQLQVIGIAKKNINIQTLVHELCHAIAFIDGYAVKDNILYTSTGFDFTSYDFSDGMKGSQIEHNGTIFNEVVTENLAVQVMDAYDKNISHEPEAYTGYAFNFMNFFRSEKFNKIIIDSYINHDNNFFEMLDEMVDQQTYLDSIYPLYNRFDNNVTIRDYFDRLSNMKFSEFFNLYYTYSNKLFGTIDGINREDFKIMKQINQMIIVNIGDKIKEEELSGNKVL